MSVAEGEEFLATESTEEDEKDEKKIRWRKADARTGDEFL